LVLVMTRVLVLVLERRLSFASLCEVRSSLPLELPRAYKYNRGGLQVASAMARWRASVVEVAQRALREVRRGRTSRC